MKKVLKLFTSLINFSDNSLKKADSPKNGDMTIIIIGDILHRGTPKTWWKQFWNYDSIITFSWNSRQKVPTRSGA